MTVLAAAITRLDGVVIAADSQISWESTKSDEGPGKLWVEKDRKYIFGGCGSIRAIQVIQHWTEWPEFRDYHRDNVEKFVIKEIVPALKAALEENGALESAKKIESFGAGIIMAWEDNLIAIDEDFSITIPISGRWAMGSGGSEALGSLGDEGTWTKNDVIKAAKNASKTALGVGGDIYYITSKSLEVKKS
jgi:ATP-dependent protease HslVU (ClpYQ) peptidase subunit